MSSNNALDASRAQAIKNHLDRTHTIMASVAMDMDQRNCCNTHAEAHMAAALSSLYLVVKQMTEFYNHALVTQQTEIYELRRQLKWQPEKEA